MHFEKTVQFFATEAGSAGCHSSNEKSKFNGMVKNCNVEIWQI